MTRRIRVQFSRTCLSSSALGDNEHAALVPRLGVERPGFAVGRELHTRMRGRLKKRGTAEMRVKSPSPHVPPRG